MIQDQSIAPVIMFHSIGLEGTDWLYSHLSLPVQHFEMQLEALASSGYRFIFWNELYEYMQGRRIFREKLVMLTFDDGYLDNWVYAFPVLKRYGAKATIFVTPEFADPRPGVRPQSGDMQGAGNTALENRGFITWDEARLMEESGLVDIQSHALTHTWYFSARKVVDFIRPGRVLYPWVAWNTRPDRKPFYMVEDQSKLVTLGTPVYEHEKALVCRRFLPPPEVGEGIAAYVNQEGGPAFFERAGYLEGLRQLHESLMNRYESKCHIESDTEYQTRVRHELVRSKEILETQLRKKVEFICWPGGGYNPSVTEIAQEVGYKSWTLSSRDESSFRNRPGADPTRIKRISCFDRYVSPGGKSYGEAGKAYFLASLARHQGSLLGKWTGRALLALAMAKSLLLQRKKAH